jgi:hypothetical protein
MADTANGAPTAGGGRPAWQKWALIGGVALLAYYLYSKYQANQAANSTASGGASTPNIAGTQSLDPNTGQPLETYAIDPNTGLPINPSTGQDFGVSQLGSASAALGTWITNAYAAATSAGAAPGLTNQALYDYTNGNPLSNAEAGVINTIEGKIGLPPGGLYPFEGTVAPATTSAPSTSTTLSAIQQYVNTIYSEIHARTGPKPTASQKALAEADVKSGKASLPSGFTAPAGYTLNPSTRILTKKAA